MSSTRWVIAAGTFDLLHPGHIYLFERAASLGCLCVFVNTDRFVKEFKGRAPVQDEAARLRVIRALKHTTMALRNDNADLRKTLVKELNPDSLRGCLIVVGGDYDVASYKHQTQIDDAWLQEHGASFLFIPRIPGYASSSLRERLTPAT